MKFRMPPNLLLMLGFMALALVATWLIPAGTYQTTASSAGAGAATIVPGTYARLPDAPLLPPWTLATVVPRALAQAQGVIFFILLVGGAFGVLRRTQAIEAGISRVMTRFRDRQGLLIFFGVAVFTLLSSFFGMASEYIPFAAVLAALCASLRLDAMTASGILLVGYGVGYGASTTNPFSVILAQEIAGLPPGSGLMFRLVVLACAFLIGFHHVWSYARRARADPQRALAPLWAASDAEAPPDAFVPMTRTRVAVLVLMALSLVALMSGIVIAKWSLPQLSALFIGVAFAVGAVSRMPAADACQAFVAGASRMTGVALLVGFARSIALILEDGQVLHTVIHFLSGPLAQWPPHASAVGMLLIQGLIDVVISSGTGQAFATMPIMAPLADLVGVTRQVSVLAYQFGGGFVDLITPTNPFLFAILGITGVAYPRWIRFVWPLVLKLMAFGAGVMVIAVEVGLR
jgi:uncharacterized ion transporter superfamily protein YfcC